MHAAYRRPYAPSADGSAECSQCAPQPILTQVDLERGPHGHAYGTLRLLRVWRTIDAAIDWFSLRGGTYVRIEPDADGMIESQQFPGLRLHVPSLLAGDLATVVARLRVAT
jgi:hypothetical protein